MWMAERDKSNDTAFQFLTSSFHHQMPHFKMTHAMFTFEKQSLQACTKYESGDISLCPAP